MGFGIRPEAAMTVSARRKFATHGTAFPHSKRARRFWGSMAGALREASRLPDEPFAPERKAQAMRAVSFDESWRPAAA